MGGVKRNAARAQMKFGTLSRIHTRIQKKKKRKISESAEQRKTAEMWKISMDYSYWFYESEAKYKCRFFAN